MKFMKALLLSFVILFSGQLMAQDIHWSLFNMSPLTLNPANTGGFEGTFRVGGIYRDQARSVLGNLGYQTPSIYVDAPILMVGKRNWIGVGASIYSDKAGAGALSNSSALFSVAFHAPTDRKGKSVFSFALQGGYSQRSVDTEKLNFADESEFLGGAGFGVAGSTSFDDARISNNGYLDFGAGIMYKTEVNKQTRVKFGLSTRHVPANYGLIESNENRVANNPDVIAFKLPMRFNLHGNFDFDLNKKWVLSPKFLFTTLKKNTNIQVQMMSGYHFNKKENVTLNFGLGYRLRDAAEFLLAMDYKSLRVGASYDMTLSGLNDINNTVGGFEIGVSYIATIFKSADVKPVIFCPRF